MKSLKRTEGVMNSKITPDHLGRGAVVYVRQSSMGQVAENTESRRRQYALAESARTMGFALPPGYCWNDIGQIEIDPDEWVAGAVRIVLDKFRELGSARQVMLWAQDAGIKMPVTRRSVVGCKIEWRRPAYHSILQILR